MNVTPMTEEQMMDALRGQQDSPLLKTVLHILKAGEIDAINRIRIGQTREERADLGMVAGTYGEAQELILEKLDKANPKTV